MPSIIPIVKLRATYNVDITNISTRNSDHTFSRSYKMESLLYFYRERAMPSGGHLDLPVKMPYNQSTIDNVTIAFSASNVISTF